MMYKVEGLSEKAMQFQGRNDYLINEAFEKSHIFVRIIEVDGWLKIVLEVDEDAKATQIRKAVPYALELRDKLLVFQGAWMGGGDNLLLEQLSQRQEHNQSYKQLAKMINAKVETYLREYLAYREEVDRLYPQFKNEFEGDFYFYAFSTKFKNSCFGLNHARDLLRALAFKDEEITELLTSGLENIKAGQEPFDEDCPMSQLKMIDKLKTWRKGKKHRAIKAQE